MKKINLMKSLLITTLSTTAYSAETDQFYASKAIIKDSSNELNTFFHEKIENALDKVNKKNKLVSCRIAAKEVLQHIVGEIDLAQWAKDKSFSQVSVFTQNSPLIDRFPEESISEEDYRAQSIYKNRPFPFNAVGVARTLNVNGVYIGTDKIGHFSIIGKKYYKNFLKGLDKGMDLEKAQAYAVDQGLNQEIAILGYAIGGTFAYSDLEANYQGLQFARKMCEGEETHLIQVNKRWVHNPSNLFDIKKYVNPKYDEAYNVSFWSPRLWKTMKNEIISGFCKNKADPDYQARANRYNKVVTNTINDVYLEEFLKEHPKFDRSKQLLSKTIKCD